MEEINYKFPNSEILIKNSEENKLNIEVEKEKIKKFFQNYKIDIDCKEIYVSINSITYVIDLKYKTKVNTIKSYKNELMMQFNAVDVEFKVSINGTEYLGIFLIKEKQNELLLGDLISSDNFMKNNCKMPWIVGEDFNGNVLIEDITQLPHLLIAGTTGTGKSNYLNTIIVSMLYKVSPNEIKVILIDTRMVNFSRFDGIPHLLIPTIKDSKRAMGAIIWLINEMEIRYKLFANKNTKSIEEYNCIAEYKLPRIVVFIENFYDLMQDTNKEIETYIVKLVQMSRAAGIHVIISTQRSSTDVITGVLKANIPARISFKVPSQIDSRTILDEAGAENLLMYGDVLFSKIGSLKVNRFQTPYITDEEIKKIVNCIKNNNKIYYDEKIIEAIENANKTEQELEIEQQEDDDVDPFFMEAIEIVIETGEASTSFIQRRFKVGYARASRIIDQMEERGIISGYQGSKPREVLMSKERWEELKNGSHIYCTNCGNKLEFYYKYCTKCGKKIK